MRIAHVSDSYLPRLGGMELQIAGLAGHQQAAGHTVEVVTGSGPGPEPDPLPVHRVSGPRVRRPAAAVRTVLGGKFDAVHVHVGVGSPLAFSVAGAAARAGIPTVVTVHSLWAYVAPIFRSVDAVAGISRLPIRWTAVSAAAAAPVRRMLPRGTTVTMLPNGIDQGDWDQPRRPRIPDTIVIAAVMRLTVRKRTLPLLRMLRQARAEIPDSIRLRAVVLGDGPRRPAAQRYLREHGMMPWVTLPGSAPRSVVAGLLHSADVFVAPAGLESFGIAALEARCAGLPVLARASTGVVEFVRHGQEGLLSGTDEQMAAQLVRLATDEPLRESISRHNRETPCPISWDAVLARSAAAYDEAAALLGMPRPLTGARR
ncbi:MAG TPA: glycosyltransferase family 4 protein [Mycobacteriales bacterium]|nr:glycosyltransferase family 4 protein [Mycobacteriales bacterium]